MVRRHLGPLPLFWPPAAVRLHLLPLLRDETTGEVVPPREPISPAIVTDASGGGGGDADEEIASANKRMRKVCYGTIGGRSTGGQFKRELTKSLAYAVKWRAKPLDEVQRLAAQGKCPELNWTEAVLPWRPESPHQWHLDPTASAQDMARQMKRNFTQEDVDYWFALACAVRILIDDQNRTKLPPADTEEFNFLFFELENRISEVLNTALPYSRMKKAEKASEDMELQRTVANVFGVMEGSSAGAGGRSVAITGGVPPESGASSSSTQAGPTIQHMLRTAQALGTPGTIQAKAAKAPVVKTAPAVKLTPAKKSTAASAASATSASSSSAGPAKSKPPSQPWSQRSWQGWHPQAWNANTPRSWWEQ